MKIGIVGRGFVGSALSAAFDKAKQAIVDPEYTDTTIEELVDANPQAVFVCVPTPTDMVGDIDLSAMDDVLDQLNSCHYKGIVVIKSTLLPHYLMNYVDAMDFRIVYNPEFLTQRTAVHDFINPPFQIVGGEETACHNILYLYNQASKVKPSPTFVVDHVTASLIKYAANTFYATKVIFMNELKAIHDNSGAETSWEEFTAILGKNPWIGSNHLQVPGPDGHYGFGGACLPKDSEAFLTYAHSLGLNCDVLQSAVEKNYDIRKDD